MTHYLKYLVIFNFYYLVLWVVGAGACAAIYRLSGVNAETPVNLVIFLGALGAALRTGVGLFPNRLNQSHAQVTADVRAYGLMLATGFAIIALVVDLACHRAFASTLGIQPAAISLQHLLLLIGAYALIALVILNYEQRDDAAA